jgi:hypothetical protein
MMDGAGESATKSDWRDELRQLGAAEGFYEELGGKHTALHIKRGGTLIVTFENLDHVFEDGEGKMPWGFDFVTKRGWSMLGLMAHDWTWYRDQDVYAFFDRLQSSGLCSMVRRWGAMPPPLFLRPVPGRLL